MVAHILRPSLNVLLSKNKVLESPLKNGDDIAGLGQCIRERPVLDGLVAILARDPGIVLLGPVSEAAGDRNRGQDGHVRTERVLARRIDLAQNIEWSVAGNFDGDAWM